MAPTLRHRPSPLCWLLSLGALVLCPTPEAPRGAAATVVSRLGDIYLYDPQTFDSGILQRGVYARGGAGTDRGDLATGIDLPFHQDISLRLGYTQRIYLDAEDGNDLTWRLRMPVIEIGRFGSLKSNQVLYEGSHTFGTSPRDPFEAHHALGAAKASMFMGESRAHSLHGQALFTLRDQAQVDLLSPGSRALNRGGICLRGAHIAQLYEPSWRGSGKWTVTVSSLEMQWRHYGLSQVTGGSGRLDLSPLAVGIHFTPRIATYTIGVAPRASVIYDPNGGDVELGGMANLSITYRDFLE